MDELNRIRELERITFNLEFYRSADFAPELLAPTMEILGRLIADLGSGCHVEVTWFRGYERLMVLIEDAPQPPDVGGPDSPPV